MKKYILLFIILLTYPILTNATVIFSDNFDSCTVNCINTTAGPPNSASGWSWVTWYLTATYGGVTHNAAEITSPGREGVGKSFKMWKAGNVAGDYAGLNLMSFPGGTTYNHIFMRYYIKIPTAFTSGQNHKLWRLMTTGGTPGRNEIYLNYQYGNWEIYDGTPWTQLIGTTSYETLLHDGNWHCVEFEIGITSHILRFWIDDVLRYEDTNRTWNLDGNIYGMQHFMIGNTEDHSGQWQASWQAVETDDFVLSTTPIGSGGGGGGGGDTSPPYASQWTPAKNSTGVAKTNRTITFHIQDDVDVLTANGVVNIEGTNYTCGSGITCSGNGTTDASVTYTKGSDWSYDQVVNVTTSGFRDTAGNVMSTDTWSYTIASDPGPGAPNITTTSLSSGTVGTAASQTFTATGGTSPYTWAVLSGSLPPGKTLSSSGVYSGTPTTVGTYIFTVGIVDAISGIDNQALSQVINAAAPGGQTTVTIPGDQGSMEDTWIGGNDTNYSSGTFLEVYQWPAYTWANRILDNIVMGLPDNVSISSATLYMYMESWEIHGGTNPMRVHAYRVSDNVPVISTVTGNNFTGTLGAAESYTDVPLITGWYSWNVTTMAQWAYANASPLYVALDGGQDGSTDTNRVFTSREGTASLRPYLSVTYTSLVGPPGPSISAPGKLRISNFRGTFH